jgi:hypothetical protein
MCSHVSLFCAFAAAAPKAVDDTYPQVLNGPTTVYAPGLLKNDSVPCDTLATVQILAPGPQHGSVTVSADGAFTYTPQQGQPQQTDAFEYEVDCKGQVSIV